MEQRGESCLSILQLKWLLSLTILRSSGVYSVGSGLFSGIRTIGQGIGGALTGKTQRKPSASDRHKRSYHEK